MGERRRERRLVVPDEEIVVMGRHSNSVGVLKDISRGGMKIEYISEYTADGQWELIDILANRQDHVLVPSVPCNIAYDIKGMASNRSFTGLCVRVCGVCFRAMSAAQSDKLHQLLAHREVC